MLLQLPHRFKFFSFIWLLAFIIPTTFLISLRIYEVTWNYFTTAILLSIFGLTAALMYPFAIALQKKFNARRILAGVSFILAFILLFYTLASNTSQLLLLRIVHGIVFSFILAVIFMLGPESKNQIRDFLITIAPALFGFLAIFTSAIPFYLAFFVALIASFLIFVFLPDLPTKPDSLIYLLSSEFNRLKTQLKQSSKDLIHVFLAFIAIAAFSNFLPIALASEGFNFLSIGSTFVLLLLPLFLLTDQIRDIIAKHGEGKAFVTGLITMILSLLLNSLLFLPLLFYVTMVFFGFGFALFFVGLLRNWKEAYTFVTLISIFAGCLLGMVFKFATFIGFFTLSLVLLTSLLVKVMKEWISSRRLKIEED